MEISKLFHSFQVALLVCTCCMYGNGCLGGFLFVTFWFCGVMLLLVIDVCVSFLLSKKEPESQTLLELAQKSLRAHNRSEEIVTFTGDLTFKEQYRCLL